MESRLLSFLYHFNVTQDYFECHEYLESLWLDSGRPEIMKGLIQAAVSLYHLYNGNVRGALRMYQRGRPRLVDAFPDYEHIDVTKLVSDLDALFECVPQAFKGKTVTPRRIRELALPSVFISFTDSETSQLVTSWIPESLEEGNEL
ncbi:DUF309 domain-containing protein [Alicyclobacillus sp. SO9]|uniref:DUF309 domain-containing protein n=1 Tax=Alicyclobacillus sp. SO9 TaxID=2665646 RepID=UPI0018E75707|nr:DUF309 domain-containing protein [Alicyclobacillus sp. SO9]QQE77412.1 DUF309 domain-containing protein [Alicyclobacillus sp. SO9]